MKSRVLLVSSVHPASDPRIIYKIAPALSENYEVICLLPLAGKSALEGTKAISLPFYKRLFWRLLFSHPIILWKGLLLKPAIVHIFVPELIPVALIFKWVGAEVFYEVQENMFKKFEIKRYNNGFIFRMLFRFFDMWARQEFQIVVTEKAYLEQYKDLRFQPAVVRNFVSLSFTDRFFKRRTKHNGSPVFLYMGVVSMERCFDTLVGALLILRQTHPVFRVELFGPVRFDMRVANALPGFGLVKSHLIFHGYTDQRKILLRLGEVNVVAGLALLKPVADYPESYPTKLFDYMALSLPVITSDFPLYKQVVEQSACGFCIDPLNSEQLAQVMAGILERPGEALQMGNNGRNAAVNKYNWENEKKILLELYSKTTGTEMDK